MKVKIVSWRFIFRLHRKQRKVSIRLSVKSANWLNLFFCSHAVRLFISASVLSHRGGFSVTLICAAVLLQLLKQSPPSSQTTACVTLCSHKFPSTTGKLLIWGVNSQIAEWRSVQSPTKLTAGMKRSALRLWLHSAAWKFTSAEI